MHDVTLYIPCYNAEPYLGQVLPAVMDQTHPLAEVIVVDDGSSDNTASLAASFTSTRYPVRVVRHDGNKGLGTARNTGVAQATTPLVASIDADVVPHPNWLANMLEEMHASHAHGVGGALHEGNTSGPANAWRDVHMRQSWGELRRERVPFLFGANTLFRKDVIEAAGGYNEACRTNAEDVKLCEAIRDTHLLVYTPRARCTHLRRDTIGSILHTYWRWHYFGTHTPVTKARTRQATWENFKRGWGLITTDIHQGSWLNIGLDLATIGYSTWRDWTEYKRHA